MSWYKWRKHQCFNTSAQFLNRNRAAFLTFFDREKGNPKLLDLGCNDGKLTVAISEIIRSDRIFGIEKNPLRAKSARKKGIIVRVSDLNDRFPFPNKSFDVISAHQILEHLWNTHNFFKETNRVLKNGGYAVISVPNLSSLHSIFFIIMGQQSPVIHLIDQQVGNFLKGIKVGKGVQHIKAFNMPALIDLAEVYNFRVEKLAGFGMYFVPFFLQKYVSKLLPRYSIFLTIKIRKANDYKE